MLVKLVIFCKTMDKSALHTDEFSSALQEHAPRFGVRLTSDETRRLRAYYEQVTAWNARLHLVAPCSPAEFATRHILESLLALAYLPGDDAHVVDVGSGAGLPIIPCLIVRPALSAVLIEASPKKAVFLREALRGAGAHGRAQVIAERFEKIPPVPEADAVTCRALERFTELFPKLVEWAHHASALLLFGGESLREQIEKAALAYESVHIPESERRFLFIIKRSGP
jgi:16S rRNA (guanine527-N7)-methyltransferase